MQMYAELGSTFEEINPMLNSSVVTASCLETAIPSVVLLGELEH